LLGKSIREGRFRTQYNAVVIGVARGGERLYQKLGDVVLQTGDILLLEARPAFLQQQRNARDFYLVSGIEDSSPLRADKAWMALAILLGMIGLAALFEQHPFFAERDFGMLHAALIAAVAMLVTRCCAGDSARRTVDYPILIVIAATIGIGTALQKTGLAALAASGVADLSHSSPWLALATLYTATMIATEVLSNNTAAVLMFPIAMATASALGCDYMPFVVAMTIAASCGFATPLGYQTHMMVYGPGGYHFADFLRMGIPLNLVVAATTVAVTPLVFPFTA
jgi:di/tricarboxylate transporter